jgi:hypothetical protein
MPAVRNGSGKGGRQDAVGTRRKRERSRQDVGGTKPGPAGSRRYKEGLLDGDGFGEVAGLVYVAAAADGYVVRQQLQRDDLEERGH